MRNKVVQFLTGETEKKENRLVCTPYGVLRTSNPAGSNYNNVHDV